MGVRQILKIHLFPSVNCWQALSGFVMQKRLLTLDHFKTWETRCFPITVLWILCTWRIITRLKYPTGNQDISVCLGTMLATPRVTREYLLISSPLSPLVDPTKKSEIFSFPRYFLSYLLILAHLLGCKRLALSAQTIQHHTTDWSWAELLVSSCYSHIKSKNYWPYLNGIWKLILL